MDQAKRCAKCDQSKPFSEFYSHPHTADGLLARCKECARRDARENYRKNRNRYKAYERERNQRPARRRLKRVYEGRSRERSPEKYAAHTAVGNAVRDGFLVKLPCEVCGNLKSQAHHDDYSKPLDVRWLCFRCHRQHHGQNP